MIGRYYAKYNLDRSYPKGLGQDLVNSIPKERKRHTGEIKEFKLRKTRQTLNRMVNQVEDEVPESRRGLLWKGKYYANRCHDYPVRRIFFCLSTWSPGIRL